MGAVRSTKIFTKGPLREFLCFNHSLFMARPAPPPLGQAIGLAIGLSYGELNFTFARDTPRGEAFFPRQRHKFPRRACSRSIASNSALKLPLPKLRLPLRWITS